MMMNLFEKGPEAGIEKPKKPRKRGKPRSFSKGKRRKSSQNETNTRRLAVRPDRTLTLF